jgi:hypothetical protein
VLKRLIDTANNAAESSRWLTESEADASANCKNTVGKPLSFVSRSIRAYRGDASRAAFTRSAIHSFTSDSSQADDILEILIGLGKVGSYKLLF